jgi:uncharacterized protein (TIRG00374 family)
LLTGRRLWLGTVVTGGFLVLLLLTFDISDTRAALAGANYAYIALAALIYLGSLYLRAFRWRYLLNPFVSTSTRRLFPVVLVGYMTNAVLPMRLGEVVQSYYLSTREPVRTTTAFATLLIERVFDGLALLFFIALAALFLPIPGLADRISEYADLNLWVVVLLVVFPFLSFLGLMVLAGTKPSIFLTAAGWTSHRFPTRIGRSIGDAAARFFAGFEGLHRPRRLLRVFLQSLPIWIGVLSTYVLVGVAFDLHNEFDNIGLMVVVMLAVMATSHLASLMPSSQGAIGPFEFIAVLTMVFLGAPSGVATAFALLVHATMLLLPIIAGAVHLAGNHVSLKQLAAASTTEGRSH